MAEGKQYWLFKSEPESFSIADLEKAPKKTAFWDGVRNYQARNTLRDKVKLGDGVLFYHSNADPSAIVGTAEVVKAGYPDHTAWDKKDHHFDAKSDPKNPTWYMVDIKHIETFAAPITLPSLKKEKPLADMVLLQNSRLSIQPVSEKQWNYIQKLSKKSATRS